MKMRVNIVDLFDSTVETKGSQIAIEHNDETISFYELKNKALSVATLLLKRNEALINRPIAVFLPKEINTVISDLGVLYSGNAFMNLDVKMPVDRIRNILEKIKPITIITNKKYFELLKNIAIPMIDIESVEENIDYKLINERKKKQIDTDPMCIINTSGSTGTPKGVVLNHRSFFDFTDWALETFSFDGSEVIGSLSPVVFDIYDFELCMLILKGSKLILLDSSLAMFPANLLKEIDNKKDFDRSKLTTSTHFKVQQRTEFLGGITTIQAVTENQQLLFLPYYAWDNREAGKMKVWIDYQE